FGEEPAESRLFIRVALEKWADVSHLVEREVVVGLLLEEPHHLEQVRQPHLEVFFAGLEDRAFPVCVGDDEEGPFRGRRRVFGTREGRWEKTAKYREYIESTVHWMILSGDALAETRLAHGAKLVLQNSFPRSRVGMLSATLLRRMRP